MAKKLLVILLLLPSLCFSQQNEKLNAALNLQPDLIFGKKVTIKGVDTTIFTDGYMLGAYIRNHPIFDFINLEHNDKDELALYSYSCSLEKTAHYKDSILSVIKQFYIQSGTPHVDEDGNTTWEFTKADETVEFTLHPKFGCEISVSTDRLIRAEEHSGVIQAVGYIKTGREFAATNYESDVFFTGYKIKKQITMAVYGLHKHSILSKIKIDSSSAISLNRARKVKGNFSGGSSIFIIPDDIAEKVYAGRKITLFIEGKYSDEITLSAQLLKMFKVIYDAVYKN